jgi:hypothetical protein
MESADCLILYQNYTVCPYPQLLIKRTVLQEAQKRKVIHVQRFANYADEVHKETDLVPKLRPVNLDSLCDQCIVRQAHIVYRPLRLPCCPRSARPYLSLSIILRVWCYTSPHLVCRYNCVKEPALHIPLSFVRAWPTSDVQRPQNLNQCRVVGNLRLQVSSRLRSLIRPWLPTGVSPSFLLLWWLGRQSNNRHDSPHCGSSLEEVANSYAGSKLEESLADQTADF